eukprot:GHUV01021095.1.p1 GENE.GHUV01021095.1~~GHUV01021095.1.p1  ORF type:complete len:112 (+),score=4.26 GHUV01021095.1:198-533(+)
MYHINSASSSCKTVRNAKARCCSTLLLTKNNRPAWTRRLAASRPYGTPHSSLLHTTADHNALAYGSRADGRYYPARSSYSPTRQLSAQPEYELILTYSTEISAHTSAGRSA